MFQTYSIADFLNQPEKKIDFYVGRFESMADPEDLNYPHKHNFYEILFVEQGNTRQTIDYQEFDIRPGHFFVISPHCLHMFEDWDEIRGYCLMFTEDFLLNQIQNKSFLFEQAFLDGIYTRPCLDLGPSMSATAKSLFDLLIAEFNREDAQPDTLASLLFVLLKQIQRHVRLIHGTAFNQNQVALVSRFVKLLETHFHESMTAKEYALHLGITAHHLNLKAKQLTRKTTTELIQERKILEAKRLLTFTDDPVSDIAWAIGFQDSPYFNRVFKKFTGLSPLAFRTMSEKYK